MEETNLSKVKEVCKLLYDCVPIKDVGFGICQHPYHGTTYDFNQETKKLINLAEDEEARKIARERYMNLIEESDLVRLYMLVRTPYKMLWFKWCNEFLSDKDYGNYLEDCWVSQENPNQDVNVSRKESVSFFKKADKKYLMTEEDCEYYQNLPDKIKIWRGVSPGREKWGLSWTDDKEKAIWFKERFESGGLSGYVLEADVDKSNVLSYFNSRNESELVVDVFKIKKSVRVL